MLIIKRANNSELIRLLLAILVVYSHAFAFSVGYQFTPHVFFASQLTYGGLAVDLFIFLSGILVSASFYNSRNLSDFYLKRILRIFPELIIFCVMSLAFGFVLSEQKIDYWQSLNTYQYLLTISLFLTQFNIHDVAGFNGQIWTLKYEFLFYILLPFLLLIGRSGILWLFIVLLLLSCLHYMYTPNGELHGIVLTQLYRLLLYFACGVFYFHFLKPYNLSVALISFGVIIFCALIRANSDVIFALCGTYFIYYITFGSQLTLHVLFNKIGDLSYGLYLYHYPIGMIMNKYKLFSFSPIMFFIINTFVGLILAWISYHIVGVPCLNLKNKFKNKK